MKLQAWGLMILLFAILCTGCGTISYVGDTAAPTNSVDVYYSARDVKREFTVIGHMSTPTYNAENDAKKRIVEKAKKVGADAIIISSTEYTGGNNTAAYIKADAIKYK